MDTRDLRIDYLRVGAIAFVLLHHADDYASGYLRITPWLAVLDDTLTFIALAVLFALSGFLTLRSSSRDDGSGWGYLVRRLGRLYVPFLIALVLFKVFGVFDLDWRTVLVNAALLGPWVGPDVGTLWFVEVLIFYQATYAVWLSIPRLRAVPWSAPAVTAALTLIAGVASSRAGLALDARVAVYLPAFAGAVAVGACARFSDDRTRWTRELLAGSLAALGLSAAVAAVPVWGPMPWAGFIAAAVATIATCALLLAPSAAAVVRGRTGALVHLLAYGSYMTYLSHRLVYTLVAGAAAPLGSPWVGLLVLASIPLIFGLGIALQRGYDAVTVRRSA